MTNEERAKRDIARLTPDANNNEWREFEDTFSKGKHKKLCQFVNGVCSQCGHSMTAKTRRMCEKAGGRPIRLPKLDARQRQPSRTFKTTNTVKPVATVKCVGELGSVCPNCKTHILMDDQVCGRQTIPGKKCCGQ